MIVDHKQHHFDNCPTCRGMVLLIPYKETPVNIDKIIEANNRAQQKECERYLKTEKQKGKANEQPSI